MLNTYSGLSAEQEAIVSEAIGCGIAVHKELGPGFKECIYHRALQARTRLTRYFVRKR